MMKFLAIKIAEIKNNENVRLFSSNLAWLLGDKVLRLLVGIFVSAWVARYLGPEQYGTLAYAIAFIAIFQALALLGLDNLVVRDAASLPESANKLIGTAACMRVVSATASYVLLLTVAYFSNQENSTRFLVIGIVGLSIFLQVSDVIDLWFQSQVQSRRTVVAKAISYLSAAAVKIILIVFGAGLSAFAGAVVVESALSAFALCIAYKSFKTNKTWCWDRETAVQLIRQSWPLLLSSLSIIIYMRISTIYLGTLGSKEVGIYTIGTALSELCYFFPMVIGSSLAPFFSKMRLRGEIEYNLFLKKIFRVMWLVSLIIAGLNSLLAHYSITLIYGTQYVPAVSILQIHSFTFIPVCIGVLQNIWLVNAGRSKLALYQAGVGAVCAIIFNVILIDTFGIKGAAFATLFTQFIQAFLVNMVLAPQLFKLQLESLLLVFAIDRK